MPLALKRFLSPRYFTVLFIPGLFFLLLSDPSKTLAGAKSGLLLWFNTVLPTLLPFIIMSGLIVPLKFFPEWAQTFMRYQPFAGIQDLPNQVFCGSLPPESILWIIPLQILWIIVFVIMGRALMHTSIKRISVAGG